MWLSFVAVFRKEFLHILRDKGTLAAAFSYLMGDVPVPAGSRRHAAPYGAEEGSPRSAEPREAPPTARFSRAFFIPRFSIVSGEV
jgi:hypothetical protein